MAALFEERLALAEAQGARTEAVLQQVLAERHAVLQAPAAPPVAAVAAAQQQQGDAECDGQAALPLCA